MPVLLLLFSFLHLLSRASSTATPLPPPPPPAPFNFSFSFPTSASASPPPQIRLLGGAHFTSSALAIPPSGLVLYRCPINFPAFSTYFSLSFSPAAAAAAAAADVAFFLTLPALIPIPIDSYSPPPALLQLRFLAAAPSAPSARNSSARHLEIHVGGDLPLLIPTKARLVLANGHKLHSWLDYNGTSNRLELRLRLRRARAARPQRPLLSYPMATALSGMLCREDVRMVLGFSSAPTPTRSASASASANTVSLYEWSFVAPRGAPYLMHSDPLDPTNFSAPPTGGQMSRPWAVVLALIFAAACGAMATFFALFVWFSVCAHGPVAPVEYPVHPAEVIYERMVVAGMKEACAKQQATAPPA